MVPLESFRQFAEGLVDQARELLVRDGRLVPFVFVFPEQGPPTLMNIGPFDKALKMHQIVRQIVRELGGVAFIQLGEAWMKDVDRSEVGRFLDDGVRVRELPGRGEAVTVFAAHPEGRFWWLVPFSREGGGIRYGRVEFLEGAQLRGGMADVLEA